MKTELEIAPATVLRNGDPDWSRGVPWYIWCAVLAVTSAMVGGHWDISWHSSIGRDTFWTPAHMAIYMCGILAGVAFGYLILSTTLSKSAPLAESSVHIWGFRAPLGAFIASWGGIAMLTSAPFDNWWHAAYGLDVKIVSPPHIVLFIGSMAFCWNAGLDRRAYESDSCETETDLSLAVPLRRWNHARDVDGHPDGVHCRAILHNALPYILVSVPAPIVMAVASRATGMKFAATFVAAFYTLFLIGLILSCRYFQPNPSSAPSISTLLSSYRRNFRS